jgi:hypothetical protein
MRGISHIVWRYWGLEMVFGYGTVCLIYIHREDVVDTDVLVGMRMEHYSDWQLDLSIIS